MSDPVLSEAAAVPDRTSLSLERRIILLVGATQFVNMLDFIMVLPLGPDFAKGIGIPLSHIGIVGGMYTAAAFIAGLAGSLFLDRYDRRKALIVAILGLMIATIAGGLAFDLPSLLAARMLAGLFGGPAAALAIAIVSDAVAPERRGRAMGAVGGSFAIASVVGVPVGLELSRLLGWRAPFFAVGALALVIAIGVTLLMPPQRAHLAQIVPGGVRTRLVMLRSLLMRRTTLLGYGMLAAGIMGTFIVVPNISGHIQQNLGFPRDQIGLLYLVGGFISFFGMRVVGRIVDRFGGSKVAIATALLMIAVLYFCFVDASWNIPLIVLFPAFMVINTARMVTVQTTMSKVPHPQERASFQSLASAVQHAGATIGAFLSSLLLTDRPDGHIDGMPAMAITAMVIGLVVPLCMIRLERSMVKAF